MYAVGELAIGQGKNFLGQRTEVDRGNAEYPLGQHQAKFKHLENTASNRSYWCTLIRTLLPPTVRTAGASDIKLLGTGVTTQLGDPCKASSSNATTVPDLDLQVRSAEPPSYSQIIRID